MSHALYKQLLVDHYRKPRHSQLLTLPTHQSDTANHSCGDRVQATLTIEDGIVTDVGILTEGCALAVAGGSVIAEHLIGKKATDVIKITNDDLLKLLGGIKPSTSRAQCVLLALTAVRRALGSSQG